MGGHFEIAEKQQKVNELTKELNNQEIWNDPKKAQEINTELSSLQKIINTYTNLNDSITTSLDLLNLSTINEEDEILNDLNINYDSLEKELNELEINTYLNKEYDKNNCYLEIHPGAGGTESCDWASLLLRMYTMYLDKSGFTYEIIDKQPGETAGIKSVLLKITGLYAYGYLKSEIGVHRLVRISPFDSNARRHTSFAAVSVLPEFTETKDVEIKEIDIRVDVFRSSGCGGQGVNTTDSAVRITHIPTGIVVTCQNERSQIKNKETALKVLKNKLYKIELDKREDKLNSLKGSKNIDFGSQIRNYTLEPYTLVKDVRTGYENINATKVLDGDIQPFIDAYLKWSK